MTHTATEPRIEIFDDVLPMPVVYRDRAMALPYGDIQIDKVTFRGIALCQDLTLPFLIQTKFLPGASPMLSFFRQSPLGQVEPNYIHSDAGMGDWTAIFYLNPTPPAADGTTFWRHRQTGAIRGPFDPDLQAERAGWEPWKHVAAVFNRLLIFEADLYHSRAIAENYGTLGVDARLTQIVFSAAMQ